jgi:chemotaxis protein CheX
MTVPAGEVHNIVAEIWESMLGLPVDHGPDDAIRQPGREVFAAVQITGGWEGAVIIECDEAAADSFTRAMLGLEDEEPSESDVHDVMGELANMAGGNVKAMVGDETRLSLPTVVVGEHLDLSVPGADTLVSSNFLAGGVVFTVVVMAKAGPAIAAVG